MPDASRISSTTSTPNHKTEALLSFMRKFQEQHLATTNIILSISLFGIAASCNLNSYIKIKISYLIYTIIATYLLKPIKNITQQVTPDRIQRPLKQCIDHNRTIQSILKFQQNNSHIIHFINLSLVSFLAGFLVMEYRLSQITQNRNYVDKFYRNIQIQGTIERNSPHRKGQEVTISDITFINNLDLRAKPPQKIRIIHKHNSLLQVGSRISAKGSIFPLPEEPYPNFYNIKNKYKFRMIDGLGSFNKIQPLPQKKSEPMSALQKTHNKLQQVKYSIRRKFENTINLIKDPDNRSFALSAFLGNRNTISKSLNQTLSDSGISHLASISGLHMSIITGVFFVIIARLMAIVPALALGCNIRKISAFLSITISLAYLAIINFPISALRSYIMSLVFLLSIIYNRNTNTFRSFIIAGMSILIFAPEELMFTSFQFSFIAVGILIAVLHSSQTGLISILSNLQRHAELSPVLQAIFNILSTIAKIAISSLLISIALTPFVIYHFSRVATYSVFTNIIAIPLFSTALMPIGVISLLTGSEMLVTLTSKIIDIILYIAHTAANAPYATWHAGEMLPQTFALFACTTWMILFFKHHTRYLGMLLWIVAITAQIFTPKPDVVFNNRYIAIKKSSSEYALLDLYSKYRQQFEDQCGEKGYSVLCKKMRTNQFLVGAWSSKLGIDKFTKKYYPDLKCINGCCYNNHLTILFGHFNEGISHKCQCSGKYLLDLRFAENDLMQCLVTDGSTKKGMCARISNAFGKTCNLKKIITLNSTKKYGTSLIFYKKNSLKTTHGK